MNWEVDKKRTESFNIHVHSTSMPMGATRISSCEGNICLVTLALMVLILAIFPSSSSNIFLFNLDLLLKIRCSH